MPAGPFVMGTSADPWALDNERPAHRVDLPGYHLDTTPVSNAAYRAFVESGGYDDERLWSAAGWQWRCRSGKRSPAFWVRDSGSWLRRRFGALEPLPDEEPVQHVCYFEAEAYARSVGRRLPTEAEWEKAASWDPVTETKRRHPWGDADPGPEHANLGQTRTRPAPVGSFPAGASAYGVLQLLGDVWEWTSTDFTGHPGFCTYPYREYSEVFFGPEHKVLRGGSWATDPLVCRSHLPQLGLPDPAADLRRVPDRAGRLMCRHLAYLGPPDHPGGSAADAAALAVAAVLGATSAAVRHRERRRLRRRLVRTGPVGARALSAGAVDLERRLVRLPGAHRLQRLRRWRRSAPRRRDSGRTSPVRRRSPNSAGCSATTDDWPTGRPPARR